MKNQQQLSYLEPLQPLTPLHPQLILCLKIRFHIFNNTGSHRYSWLICLLILKSIYQNYNIFDNEYLIYFASTHTYPTVIGVPSGTFIRILLLITMRRLFRRINGQVGYNSSDCVRIREYTLTHNTSYLTVKFSALTTEANPAVQFWGIKELFVVTKDCHSYCITCFGALSSQCLSCAAGYYLQGNVCLQQCDPNFYIVLDTRICVSECPLRYFSNVDSNTLVKQCLAC